MNVGSLFSGIGGIDLGLERAGMEVVWQCESNEFCRQVLAERFPGVLCYHDVRELPAAIERVDLICGGFPCQPVSVAGKRLAQADERWLWPAFALAVRELRPRYVLVENVPGLLARGGGMGDVLRDLAGCGYVSEWDCLPASAFGAPHLRYRVWLVAHAHEGELRVQSAGESWCGCPSVFGDDGTAEPLADADGEGKLQQGGAVLEERGRVSNGGLEDADLSPVEPRGRRGRTPETGELADADASARDSERPTGKALLGPEAIERSGRCGGGSGHAWAVEPDVGRVAHGVPSRLDRLASLGNAVVPQVAEWIGRRIIAKEAVV